ncbi:MAG: UbiA family prenyltransferase [Burkholderiales bacterium]|nr:UbiA family prenyltransferase [Burkholderiales bacterium]
MNLPVALRLGRISNLPTVWTNVVVGVVLAGGAVLDVRVAVLVVALSLFYVGGMFLNDAFDREFDGQHRKDRPIPSGQVTATEVFAFGFGMLAIGFAAVTAIGIASPADAGWQAAVAALALGAAIVLYNGWHKQNPLSPLVMGLCRVLVYVAATVAIAGVVAPDLCVAAVALLCYLIGLTYIAKQEHLDRIGRLWPLAFLAVPVIYGAVLASDQPFAAVPLVLLTAVIVFCLWLLRRRSRGDVPRAVVTLIAGISLLDATVLAGHGAPLAAGIAIAAFGVTLALQRWVSGT